ncbi:MAG: sulfur oxidation c-type cytochrome SoxX [Hyphomicrobiaceae bacterium]
MSGVRWLLTAVTLIAAMPPAALTETVVAEFAIDGDAIAAPLGDRVGDATRGRAIVLDRRVGNCLICHRVPVPQEPFQGEIGPDLGGIGSHLSVGQLRLRLVDPARLNAATVMPPYHRTFGVRRVAPAFAGAPVLTAQEVEDVVAWLASLK